METTQSFINGQSVASPDTYDNIDPATGQSLGQVARSGEKEVDQPSRPLPPHSPAGIAPSPRSGPGCSPGWPTSSSATPRNWPGSRARTPANR